METDRYLPEGIVISTPDDAKARLSEIWDRYYTKKKRTPEDEAAHRKAIREFDEQISDRVQIYLESPTEVTKADGAFYTQGQLIQERARRIAESRMLQASRNHTAESAGSRLHKRRLKAQERRGTPPGRIH